ncbi:hypothetical protein FAUST_11461 [Fusarium austroamericanum]|uniref:NWD NACHT-NTPase N-terminal domain-containing protein n=1 Tax=Fusarium austroamericanum TaxID=282268 RepID=A0AAN6BV40_FUSAU|nr:hypothetical protein FAUST_11461 [Fusarium austroamericanum]
MKTASQPSAPHNVGSKIKHLVGKIRRHSNPPPPESSSASPSSTANPSRESSSCPLPHIGRHSQRNSRRGSASEEDERVHDLELWNAAYDVLRRDHTSSSLVLAYENIISHALPDSLRPGHNGNSDGLPTDDDRRAELMMMIAKSGLEREVKEVSQTDSGDGEAREYVIQTRSVIASLLDDQPSTAIAWAGFCSLTPLLLDPLLRHEDIRQGFVHITNAIPHYMTLHRALHPSSWTSLPEFQRLQPHLRQTLLNLYRRILEYEMNIVCAAASAWNMAARNVVDWHGWKARSDAVRDTDAELMSQVDKSGTDEAKALMEVQRKLDPEGGGRGEPTDDTLNHNI